MVTPESSEIVRAFSSSLPASVAQQLLRTWANGCWANGLTTSFRMHETQLLNCFFGCFGQPDNQQHYLRCSNLRCVINCVLGPCPAEGFLSHLCLVNCSVLSAARLVEASLSYHCMNNYHLRFLLRLSAAGIWTAFVSMFEMWFPHRCWNFQPPTELVQGIGGRLRF